MALIYVYKCCECDKVHEIKKEVKDSSRTEHCPDCNMILKRVWWPVSLKNLPTKGFVEGGDINEE